MKQGVMIIAVMLFCAGQAEAGGPRRLKDFGAIMDSLRSGREVRAVFDWSACTLLSLKEFTESPSKPEETSDQRCRLSMHGKPADCYFKSDKKLNAVSGMKLGTWEYFGPGFISPRGYLSSSDTHLISIRGFVLNYGSVKVYEDSTVAVKVNYLRPASEAGQAPGAEATPLRVRKGEDGKEATESKTLSQQEYLIVMDEMFSCAVSSRAGLGGASFFEAD